jgi:hypothetical protein
MQGQIISPKAEAVDDINASANLRPSVAAAFGFDPFERVVDYLEGQLARRQSRREQPSAVTPTA